MMRLRRCHGGQDLVCGSVVVEVVDLTQSNGNCAGVTGSVSECYYYRSGEIASRILLSSNSLLGCELYAEGASSVTE